MRNIKIVLFQSLGARSFISRKLKVQTVHDLRLPKDYCLAFLNLAFIDGSFRIEIAQRDECLQQVSPNAVYAEHARGTHDLCLIVSSALALKADCLQDFYAWLKLFMGAESNNGVWIFADSFIISETEQKTVPFKTVDLSSPTPQLKLFSTKPRYFNELTFSESRVTKTSTWKQKARSEISFLKSVPTSLQDYFLPLLSSHEDQNTVSYTIPAVECFDLGLLAVHGGLTDSDWDMFYKVLNRYFDKLPWITVDPIEYQAELRHLFIEKLSERLQDFQENIHYEKMVTRFTHITAIPFQTQVAGLISALDAEFSKIAEDRMHFSHGDLCFSNILYDPEMHKIFLIDPRGIENPSDQYRPLLYDLVKLTQCAVGGYDFIMQDLTFEAKHPILEKYFWEFMQQFPYSRALLRLCEASLLWSLLPLHADNEEHVLRFMVAGASAYRAGVA